MTEHNRFMAQLAEKWNRETLAQANAQGLGSSPEARDPHREDRTMSDRESLYEKLSAMPTLAQGHTDDLKCETDDGYRYWLARTGLADGEPFEHTVHTERLEDGRWVHYSTIDGDVT